MTERAQDPESEADPTRPDAGVVDRPTPDPDDELIDEVGQESFPASDAPSSWSGPPTGSH